jgi:ubiquitin-conjugating enzyme E2 D/E
MQQIDSFGSLPITSREHSYVIPFSSCSELTQLLGNEAEEFNFGSGFSSPESTPIMTPETSDDEDEEENELLPEVEYQGSDESVPLLELTEAAPEQVIGEARDLLYAPTSMLEELFSNAGPDQRLSIEETPSDFEDEDHDPVSTPTTVLGSSENSSQDFHNALPLSELCYGVMLSPIRQEDRDTLERITEAESRSRMRIHRELKSLHEDETVPYLSVAPIDGDLGNCLACMEGAPDTPYEGGIFWLHIDFPTDYPVRPPIIEFLTPVYHPNIEEHGRISIDMLEAAWSPCLQIQQVLLSILSVLHSPIVDDGTLIPEIAEKYLFDYQDFCDIVRVYTASASGSRPDTTKFRKSNLSRFLAELPSLTKDDDILDDL